MSTARAALAVAAAFVAAQVLAVIVHGVILSADYEPFEGSLLRAAGGDQPPWQMVFLPVAHLVYVSTMVWLYAPPTCRGFARCARGDARPRELADVAGAALADLRGSGPHRRESSRVRTGRESPYV
jgi:hypothetical protein